MKYDYAAIGKRIKTLRKLHGYSQEELSREIIKRFPASTPDERQKCSRQRIIELEKGNCGEDKLTLDILTAICEILECDAAYILGEIPEKMEGKDMDEETRDAIYRECIEVYGAESQIDVAIEEMSELTKALLKWKRAPYEEMADLNKKRNRMLELRSDVVSEIADVRIMCRQMELFFKAEDEVERRIDIKTDRQAMRLESRMGQI